MKLKLWIVLVTIQLQTNVCTSIIWLIIIVFLMKYPLMHVIIILITNISDNDSYNNICSIKIFNYLKYCIIWITN